MVPILFVSGTMGEDAAIEALTAGATDYVLKIRLAPAVKRARPTPCSGPPTFGSSRGLCRRPSS